MKRARFVPVAALAVALFGVSALAQTVKAPPLKPILAGKHFTPPIRGQADVEFTAPVTRRDNKAMMVITKIDVKNISNAPIPRLTIDETWYDKGGATVAGGKGLINGLLQPGEVQTVVIETPWKQGMTSNNYNFSHANGTIKPHRVKSFEDDTKDAGKDEAAKKN